MSDIEKSLAPPRRLGNPAPLGLFSFASTTLVLSLYNVHARHVVVPNAVVGMALFYGGLAQLLAGMWEFATGNTFGATAFSSYGAFWLSFATLFIPGSGIADAYAADTADPAMELNAIGIYLLSWMIVTFLFFIGSLRKSIGLSSLFLFLTSTFLLLAIGFLNQKDNIVKVGGYFGIATALIAYYCGLADMLGPNDLFTLPTGKHEARRLD
ncbi:GPR1/FUN34/yaaH family-domain-containing protein [Russula aff. rugulosa BPL654]|nr:GPR1/FUN34/yaaH family-domain-containing protein [Russula aff. rugulosa BPL654]